MGCDIHMYIEYKKTDDERWRGFAGRLNPGRNYFIFGILSKGVRTIPAFSFDPKGLPVNLGFDSCHDNQLYISDGGGDGTCSIQSAHKWVTSGQSVFINDNTGKPTWVTNPDWHSHSWLSIDEYNQAMDFYNKNEGDYPEPEYNVVLTIMQRFGELGFESRLVFWFDN